MTEPSNVSTLHDATVCILRGVMAEIDNAEFCALPAPTYITVSPAIAGIPNVGFLMDDADDVRLWANAHGETVELNGEVISTVLKFRDCAHVQVYYVDRAAKTAAEMCLTTFGGYGACVMRNGHVAKQHRDGNGHKFTAA